jgi:hypothetical protein
MQTSISLQEGRKGSPGQGGTEDPRCADRTARRQTVREVYLIGLFSASQRREVHRSAVSSTPRSSRNATLSCQRDFDARIHLGDPGKQAALEIDRALDSVS